jgi:hypothetical protein
VPGAADASARTFVVIPAFDAANTLVAWNIVAPITPPPSIAALTRPAVTARFTLVFMFPFLSFDTCPLSGYGSLWPSTTAGT